MTKCILPEEEDLLHNMSSLKHPVPKSKIKILKCETQHHACFSLYSHHYFDRVSRLASSITTSRCLLAESILEHDLQFLTIQYGDSLTESRKSLNIIMSHITSKLQNGERIGYSGFTDCTL